jgi:hypothetical protein
MNKLTWRPSHRVQRALRGDRLPCGCIVGVYELYSGLVLSVVDVSDAACRDAGHRPHSVLPGAEDEARGRRREGVDAGRTSRL